MSYGLKWTLEFENVEETADYKIELLKLDYEDEDGTIDTYPNGEALEFVNRGSRSNIDDVIFGTEFVVRFVLTKSELATYDDLFYCKYKEWQCKIYKDETLINVGYIRPENFGIEWMGPTYTASVSFTDGLNDLKQQQFAIYPSVIPWTSEASFLTNIKRALEWAEIELPFKIQLNTYETTLMDSDECALAVLKINPLRWRSIVNGQYVFADCHKVISDILRQFNCVMRQSNGHYEIVNYQEYNSYVYLFDWSTLTEQSRTARNVALDWDAGKFTERGQISKIAPVKKVELTIRSFSSSGNELLNPDFSAENGSPITGWTNGPGTFAFHLLTVLLGKLQAQDAVAYTAQAIHYFESDAFGLLGTATGDTLQVSIVMNPSVTMSDDAEQKPLWYIGLVRPNGSVFFDIPQNTFNGEQVLLRTVPINGGDGDYKIRFYVEPISGTTVTAYTYEFSEITAVHNRINGPIALDSRLVLTNNTDGVGTRELETIFRDTDQTTELGAIKDALDNLTSEWNRYGETDGLQINEIRALQLLNDSSRYRNYIRTTIFDINDTIFAHNAIDIDDRVYRFIAYEKNAHKRLIKAELVEIENTDVDYSAATFPLLSQDGSSTGGSSGTDTTGTPGTGTGTVTNITNITNNYYTIAENPIELVKLQYEGSISSGVVDVIPAPGAGKAIQVLDVIVLGNTTSPTEPDAYLRYADSTENICVIPMSATAALYYEIKPSAYDLKLNKAIQLATDDFVTSGTGGMQFQIYYRIIEWSGFEEL